jgi:excisionase family DNA binding protein
MTFPIDTVLSKKLKKIKIMEKELNPEGKKWLTIVQVCSLLGISKRTLQSKRDRKEIPFCQISRKILFKSSDIDEYLERHYIKANYQKGGTS